MLSSRAFPAHIHTRTPGRSTRHRGENAVVFAGHKSTKKVQLLTPHRTATIGKSPLKKSSYAQSRPFQDKTPFPNNRDAGNTNLKTPGPGHKKGKLAQEEESQFSFELNTPALFKSSHGGDGAPLPSSLRKSVKAPRLSGQFAPVTPMNKGNHWDVIEDLEFDLPEEAEVEAELITQPIVEEENDDGWEIEYMPPKLEVPYQPPFDFEIPDYKVVGEMLRNFLPPSFPKPPPEIDFKLDPELDLSLQYASLSIETPDIDDPFYRPPKLAAPAPAGARKPLLALGHQRTPSATNILPSAKATPQVKPSIAPRPRSVTTINRAASSSRVATRPAPSNTASSKQTLPRPTTAIGTRSKPRLPISQPSTRPSSVAATRIVRSSSVARSHGIRTTVQPNTELKTMKKDKDGIVLNLFDNDPGLDTVDDFKFDV